MDHNNINNNNSNNNYGSNKRLKTHNSCAKSSSAGGFYNNNNNNFNNVNINNNNKAANSHSDIGYKNNFLLFGNQNVNKFMNKVESNSNLAEFGRKPNNTLNITSLMDTKTKALYTKNSFYNRLLVVFPREANEKDLNEAFVRFGKILDILITNEQTDGKGNAFIKYSKSSEALKAMEEMDGKCLTNFNTKALRVVLSHEVKNEMSDDERFTNKLFIKIDKNIDKFELKNIFRKYGEIEHSHVAMDPQKKENKGYGFVTFFKSSDAARAIEECDACYQAKFSKRLCFKTTNKKETDNSNDHASNKNVKLETNFNHLHLQFNNHKEKENIKCNPLEDILSKVKQSNKKFSPLDSCVTENLIIKSSDPEVAEANHVLKIKSKIDETILKKLFNLIPCLVEFKMTQSGVYLAKYQNDLITYYAMKKLNQFEFSEGQLVHAEYLKENEFNKDIPKTTTPNYVIVSINCAKEIDINLLRLIMNQFNNLVDVGLNIDNKSGYALFSTELDAQLACNIIHNREIAHILMTARLEKNFESSIFNYNQSSLFSLKD